MPAQLSGPTTDPWNNFGFVYGRSGATRGTSTSSGVLNVATGFTRQCVYAQAYDEATNARTTANIAIGTRGTFFDFQPLTPDGVTARFRVRRNQLSAGGTLSSMVLATAITGVTARWLAFGY